MRAYDHVKKRTEEQSSRHYSFFSNWLASRVFPNGLGDRGSIPGQVKSKIQKMQLDTALLNTQHHKVQINGKVEQSR